MKRFAVFIGALLVISLAPRSGERDGVRGQFVFAQDKEPPIGIVAARNQLGVVAGALRDRIQDVKKELQKEEIEGGKGIEHVVEKLLARIGELKADARISKSLHPVLDRVAELVRLFPDREYAREHPGSTTRAVARELEFRAEEATSFGGLIKDLESALKLPVLDVEGEKRELPTDLPLAKFRKLGPIVIFLCKQRNNYPSGYLEVDPVSVKEGKHNVGIGVKYRGKVVRVDRAVDGDITFDIWPLHNEIKPQWRRGERAKKIRIPEPGDIVELRGWTYYDNFHEDESEEERQITLGRPTVWEVHPVTECFLIEKAKK